jgi:UDP:flavonoid glycosyltransferase YjiC (YdhE family)
VTTRDTGNQRAVEPGKAIVFSTFGSVGDLFPYLTIAAALRKKGHDVAIASSEYHRHRVEGSGIRFHATAPRCDFTDPEFRKRAFRELRILLSEPKYQSDCKRIADHVESEDGVEAACAALATCLISEQLT